MSEIESDLIKTSRKNLGTMLQEFYSRALFFTLQANYIATEEELSSSDIRAEKYRKQRREWWLRMADKYGTDQGGFLNWHDPFVPIE